MDELGTPRGEGSIEGGGMSLFTQVEDEPDVRELFYHYETTEASRYSGT